MRTDRVLAWLAQQCNNAGSRDRLQRCWASQASSGGAYWVGHSDHTDLLYLWQNIYFIAYCVPVCVTVCAIVLIQLLAAKTQ